MNTGWNGNAAPHSPANIINLLGNEYWLELACVLTNQALDYKPTGK